jgi:hypothetical protein
MMYSIINEVIIGDKITLYVNNPGHTLVEDDSSLDHYKGKNLKEIVCPPKTTTIILNYE